MEFINGPIPEWCRLEDAPYEKTDKEKIVAILEEHLFVSDEWGGSKLANWKWGYNTLVDGLDDAADAILEVASKEDK